MDGTIWTDEETEGTTPEDLGINYRWDWWTKKNQSIMLPGFLTRATGIVI